jgi:hypothetical protein
MISNQLQTEESFTVIHLARKKDSSNNNNNNNNDNNNIHGRKVHKFVKITKIGFTNSIPKNLFVGVPAAAVVLSLSSIAQQTPQPH